jgi:hypothetical protein
MPNPICADPNMPQNSIFAFRGDFRMEIGGAYAPASPKRHLRESTFREIILVPFRNRFSRFESREIRFV